MLLAHLLVFRSELHPYVHHHTSIPTHMFLKASQWMSYFTNFTLQLHMDNSNPYALCIQHTSSWCFCIRCYFSTVYILIIALFSDTNIMRICLGFRYTKHASFAINIPTCSVVTKLKSIHCWYYYFLCPLKLLI